LKEVKKGRKRFSEIFSQTPQAKCLSKNEGQGSEPSTEIPAKESNGDSSFCPLPQKENHSSDGSSSNALLQGEREDNCKGNDDERKRCLHHDFVARHQFSFGWRARQLAKGDPALQDDLTQEMSLAVLQYEKPASFEFLFKLAENRAKNYIRYEVLRGTISLDEARRPSDAVAAKIGSLNAFIEELLRRGVPAEWIDEVLGTA
jgi:hypothetical protein